MARTRPFRSGNSQAIRIPAEMAYSDANLELEVTRLGDVITIYPVRNTLKHTIETLREMPKPKRPERRVPIKVPLRKRD
jgi:antitoxin VapB